MFGIDNKIFYIASMFAGLLGMIYLLNKFFNNEEKENYESYKEELKEIARSADNQIAKDIYEAQDVSQEDEKKQLDDAEKVMAKQAKSLAEYEQPKPNDLLPADTEADEWSKANPKGNGSLELKNFTEAAFHIGVDTQANSLRNANLQLRSEPPNPMKAVSIFNNSTIGPDPFRRSMEIN
jgi:succinate dehydrogenase flavin-adding protein (antitoxin of CptAB toxin-antitoxin module)